MFGVLAGAILATSVVSRVQWLNLSRVGWWGRPVLVALVAGAVVGAFRRDGARPAALSGALAGSLSLLVVYAIVRTSVRVLWVERAIGRVVLLDVLRLLAYAVPAGAAGALAADRLRTFASSLRRAPRR